MSDIERIIERIKNATKIDLAFGKTNETDETPVVGPLSGGIYGVYSIRRWQGFHV